MKYFHIEGKVPLPDNHREAAALIANIDNALCNAELQIREQGVDDFEFEARQRTERPEARGPRKVKTSGE